MTVFRVQVFYERGSTGKWSNVWHADATDIPTLQGDFSSIAVPALLPMLDSSAQLTRFLISDLAGDQFVTTNVNSAGTSTASGDLLPLFNSAKVLLNDGGLGRPDLKYIKGFVTESIQNNGVLLATAAAALDGYVTSLLSSMAAGGSPLTSSEGDEYVSASVQPDVQMRQMHRKRRRTTSAPA